MTGKRYCLNIFKYNLDYYNFGMSSERSPPAMMNRKHSSSPKGSHHSGSQPPDNGTHGSQSGHYYRRRPPSNREGQPKDYYSSDKQKFPKHRTVTAMTKQRNVECTFLKARQEGDSDFRSHFKLENIIVTKQHEDDFVSALEAFLSNEIGKIRIIEKLDRANDGKLAISIGMLTDSAAVDYLDSKKTLEFQFAGFALAIDPALSKAFKAYFPEARKLRKEEIEREERREEERRKREKEERDQREREQREREIREQRERDYRQQKDRHRGKDEPASYGSRRYREENNRHSRREHSRSSRSPRSRSSRSRSRHKKHHRHHQRRSRSRSHSEHRYRSTKAPSNDTTLRIFGIPKVHRERDILPALKNHREGRFMLRSWGWQSLNGAEYFKISLPESDARALLNRRECTEFDQICPLIVKCGREEYAVREALRECQLRVTFERPVHPANVYRVLAEWGRVVQLVAQNRQNQSFSVTFGSAKAVKQLRALKLEEGPATIGQVSTGVLVYRPGLKTSLEYLMRDCVKTRWQRD